MGKRSESCFANVSKSHVTFLLFQILAYRIVSIFLSSPLEPVYLRIMIWLDCPVFPSLLITSTKMTMITLSSRCSHVHITKPCFVWLTCGLFPSLFLLCKGKHSLGQNSNHLPVWSLCSWVSVATVFFISKESRHGREMI